MSKIIFPALRVTYGARAALHSYLLCSMRFVSCFDNFRLDLIKLSSASPDAGKNDSWESYCIISKYRRTRWSDRRKIGETKEEFCAGTSGPTELSGHWRGDFIFFRAGLNNYHSNYINFNILKKDKICLPVEQTGKAEIMQLANYGKLPKFSKYSGVAEWKNVRMISTPTFYFINCASVYIRLFFYGLILGMKAMSTKTNFWRMEGTWHGSAALEWIQVSMSMNKYSFI